MTDALPTREVLQGEPSLDLPPQRLLHPRSKQAAAGKDGPVELSYAQFEAEMQRRGLKGSQIKDEFGNVVMAVAAVSSRRAYPTHHDAPFVLMPRLWQGTCGGERSGRQKRPEYQTSVHCDRSSLGCDICSAIV